jgi:hypothetical protein
MTTTQTDLQTAILEALQTSGLPLGTLHAYDRWEPSWEGWLDLFSTEVDGIRQIRAFELTLQSVNSEWYAFGKTVKRTYNFSLIGHIGLDDSRQTTLVLRDLSDRILDYMDARDLITETSYMYGPIVGPCQITDIAQSDFGNVLCEHVAISIPVQVVV